MSLSKIEQLEKRLGYTFKNKNYLKEALTHRSYLNENAKWPLPHNERLEYLGDAVLELITTDFLFRRFPEHDEGALTSFRAALVNFQMLGRVAGEIELDRFLLLSKGEAKDVGKAREVILANAFEALIGALYLDSGYEITRSKIEHLVLTHIDEILEKKLYRDPKSLLQEIVQEKRKITPTYQVIEERGPDHQKEFVLGVFFGEEEAAQGTGMSKQEAESKAAEAALGKLKKGKLS